MLTSAYKQLRGTADERWDHSDSRPCVANEYSSVRHGPNDSLHFGELLACPWHCAGISDRARCSHFFLIPEELSLAGSSTASPFPIRISAWRRRAGNRTRPSAVLQTVKGNSQEYLESRPIYLRAFSWSETTVEIADPFAVKVIPNAVDCEYFRPDSQSRRSPLTLLSVGRLHRQKNVSRVLEILLAVRSQSGIPAIARVIGDGPERQNLEKFAHRHDLDSAVSFEGWLPRSDVAAAYRSATVLVHLSSYEGMSNVVLEALASGLPVVASRIPENMELIEPEQNGLLFDLNESIRRKSRRRSCICTRVLISGRR